MRRAIWLLLLGLVVAAMGVATARAAIASPPLAAPTTDTTTTTTSPTTTTSTSTTTTTTSATTATPTTTASPTTTPALTTIHTATSPQPVTKLVPMHRHKAGSGKHSGKADHARKHRRKHRQQQQRRPPPDFPSLPSPFRAGGALAPTLQDDPVVALAMQYLGVPYTWGGATPKTGFDCSGLVAYVFGKLGVSLPHYAASQYYSPDAVWVRPSRLQPGDLVFFTGSDGTREAPGHVGIYVGDGYFIDAPHTGSFVRIDSLDESWFADKYVAAKRIVGVSLDARRLLHVRKPRASATSLRPGFPEPIMLEPLGESLGPAATGTAADRSALRGQWIWAGVVLGALFLLLVAGGLFVLRRRRLDAEPSTAPSA